MVHNQSKTSRSKHIDILAFHLVHHHQNNTINVQHIPSLNNLSDILTKSLDTTQFTKLKLRLVSPPTPPFPSHSCIISHIPPSTRECDNPLFQDYRFFFLFVTLPYSFLFCQPFKYLLFVVILLQYPTHGCHGVTHTVADASAINTIKA